MNTHLFIIFQSHSTRKDTKNQCDESTGSQCYTNVSHPVVQRGDSHPVGQQTLQTHEQNACWEGRTCTYIMKCFCMVHLVERQCSVIQIIIKVLEMKDQDIETHLCDIYCNLVDRKNIDIYVFLQQETCLLHTQHIDGSAVKDEGLKCPLKSILKNATGACMDQY